MRGVRGQRGCIRTTGRKSLNLETGEVEEGLELKGSPRQNCHDIKKKTRATKAVLSHVSVAYRKQTKIKCQ